MFSALQAEGRRFEAVIAHKKKSLQWQTLFLFAERNHSVAYFKFAYPPFFVYY